MGEGGDGVERELKFACDDLEAVRQRLADLGAERQAAAAFEEARKLRERLRDALSWDGATAAFAGAVRDLDRESWAV